MAVLIETIKKYAPALIFHVNEQQYPCSIETLLSGSSLKWRTWSFAERCVDTNRGAQETAVPALALFQGAIWMVYSDSNSSQLWVTNSTDGQSWQPARHIDGQHTSIPALAVFLDKLWIVYTDANSAQLWVSCSADGWTWEPARQIAGQKTSIAAIIVFENKLQMVYSSDNSSQLYHSQSGNGWDWENTTEIRGQGTDMPALAVLGDEMIMVYPTSDGGGHLLSSHYNAAQGWYRVDWLDQYAYQVALAVYNDWMVMTYSSSNSSQLCCSRSKDGITWQDTQAIGGQNGRYWPAMVTQGDKIIMIYCGTESNKPLYQTTNYQADLAARPDIPNPTQQDLYNHPDTFYYISLPGPQDNTLSGAGPVYYNTQTINGFLHIHYLFLYQFQHGQTVRALRAGTEFNAYIWRLGEHQGDLEHFQIVLQPSKGGDYDVVQVITEAHGNPTTYSPDQVEWTDESKTHAVVSIGLNGHAVWNQKQQTNPVVESETPGAVLIGDFLGDRANMWYPYQATSFVQIGLNNLDREPVNDQVWAKFSGRLGDSYHTTLDGGHYFDGSNLKSEDWTFVVMVEKVGDLLGKIPNDIYVAEGPTGPGTRNWIVTS